jgi:hypothetical protein
VMVLGAGFEPAICASDSAALDYRTLDQGSSREENDSPQAIAGTSANSATLALLILSLSACVQAPPKIVEVRIPIVAPCVERSQLPPTPIVSTDSDLAKLNDFEFVIQLASDRIALRQFSQEQQALLLACVK